MAGILNWLPAGQTTLGEHSKCGVKLAADRTRFDLGENGLDHSTLSRREADDLGREAMADPDELLIPRPRGHRRVLTVDASLATLLHRTLRPLACPLCTAHGRH